MRIPSVQGDDGDRMLRGTVYLVDSHGTPITRRVWELNTDDPKVFKEAMTLQLLTTFRVDSPPAGSRVEFGPIGAPWPLRVK